MEDESVVDGWDVKVGRRQEDGKAEATSVGGWRERRQGRAGQGKPGQEGAGKQTDPQTPLYD